MLHDPRLEKLAKVLVNYSTEVQRGQLVRIRGTSVCEPLLLAVYQQVLKAGGHPVVRMTPDECEELFLRIAGPEQLQFVSPLSEHEIKNIDVSIGIWGGRNSKALTHIDPARQALVSKSQKPIVDEFLKRSADGSLRWMVTEYPTDSAAQDAEMSLADYQDFVFGAGKLNCDDPAAAWREVRDRQQRMCDFLNDEAHELRFIAHRTDLRLRVDGRKWINCCGRRNFPDGEVYTGPIETATEGVIYFSFPAVHGGRECDGIELTFKNGRVVKATAEKGEDFLLEMLNQDDGARVLGEIGIGTNYGIQRYSRNTLFDEKIGGTFHAAVGSSYPESGGKNESALHWDLVCDLRNGGRMEVDGNLVSENGRFLDLTWPQP